MQKEYLEESSTKKKKNEKKTLIKQTNLHLQQETNELNISFKTFYRIQISTFQINYFHRYPAITVVDRRKLSFSVISFLIFALFFF